MKVLGTVVASIYITLIHQVNTVIGKCSVRAYGAAGQIDDKPAVSQVVSSHFQIDFILEVLIAQFGIGNLI